MAKEIKFLGHVLSEKGLQVDDEKIEAINKFPVPKTLKQLQSFLGVCNYFRRFINKFSDIAAPLHELLRKIHLHGARHNKKHSKH